MMRCMKTWINTVNLKVYRIFQMFLTGELKNRVLMLIDINIDPAITIF